MKSKRELLTKIFEMKKIPSKTGRASYSKFEIDGDQIHFMRDNTKKYWTVNINNVYSVYKKENFIDTTVLKKHIGGRAFSPSLAILIAAGFCDQSGNRIP